LKRVLITGSRGFVARHLTDELRGTFALTGVDLVDGIDLTKPGSLDAIDGDFHAVVHLAGLSFVPASFDRPADFCRVNFNGALTVAEFCRQRGVATLIYPNTYVYGQPQRLPVDESHPIALPSPYHLSKKLAEDLLLGYFGSAGTRVISLRVFNLYGPHQEPRFLIPQMVAEAGASGQITVCDLDPRRDYLHIKDFVRLMLQILFTEAPETGVYNVGSGQSHSVSDVIALLKELLGRPIAVRSLNQRRSGEIMDCCADITKVCRAFAWKPETSLGDGLRQLLAETQHV
jgi:nucleoside-diphosphate-sugar epimerase